MFVTWHNSSPELHIDPALALSRLHLHSEQETMSQKLKWFIVMLEVTWGCVAWWWAGGRWEACPRWWSHPPLLQPSWQSWTLSTWASKIFISRQLKKYILWYIFVFAAALNTYFCSSSLPSLFCRAHWCVHGCPPAQASGCPHPRPQYPSSRVPQFWYRYCDEYTVVWKGACRSAFSSTDCQWWS